MDPAVIVTGAAGALGHAVVAEFLRRAASPWSRSTGPATAWTRLGATRRGAAVPVDLADRAAVQAAFAAVDALPVDPFALVGLAGGFTPGKLADVDEDSWTAC